MPITPFNIEVGKRLAHFRKSNQFTQAALAELVEASQGRVSQTESGIVDIAPEWLVILAKKFRLNPMFILGFSKNIYLTDVKQGYKLGDNIPYMSSPVLSVPNVGDEE